jgi:hypothetical protein
MWKIVTEDVLLLKCFIVLAALPLERHALRELARVGQTEFEVNEWIEIRVLRRCTGAALDGPLRCASVGLHQSILVVFNVFSSLNKSKHSI